MPKARPKRCQRRPSAPDVRTYNGSVAIANHSAVNRNNVRLSGRGEQPMLFAHGYGCDQHMWRFVAPAFEERYRVVLFDHVGAGRSDLSAYDAAKYSSLRGYADDVLEICRELDLQKVIFVGHSVSAMIGVLAALAAPSLFDKLVLVGPSPRYINDDGYLGGFTRKDIDDLLDFQEANFLGWSRQLAPAIMANADRPELSDELFNSFCRTDPDIARQFAAVTFLSDNRPDLSNVHIPTLVIQCKEDVIAPTEVGEYVHKHIAGSRMALIEATGHCPHLSAPAETIRAITQFLQ
jgi:sigma-B regulation protein RsbQ